MFYNWYSTRKWLCKGAILSGISGVWCLFFLRSFLESFDKASVMEFLLDGLQVLVVMEPELIEVTDDTHLSWVDAKKDILRGNGNWDCARAKQLGKRSWLTVWKLRSAVVIEVRFNAHVVVVTESKDALFHELFGRHLDMWEAQVVNSIESKLKESISLPLLVKDGKFTHC